MVESNPGHMIVWQISRPANNTPVIYVCIYIYLNIITHEGPRWAILKSHSGTDSSETLRIISCKYVQRNIPYVLLNFPLYSTNFLLFSLNKHDMVYQIWPYFGRDQNYNQTKETSKKVNWNRAWENMATIIGNLRIIQIQFPTGTKTSMSMVPKLTDQAIACNSNSIPASHKHSNFVSIEMLLQITET